MKKSNPARYKIAQKVRSWRLRRKCTVRDLADKTGIKYYTLLKYEQGVQGIPTEDLKRLADALSIKAGGLFSRQKVLRENCCFDKAKEQAIYNLMAQTRERKAIYALTQSIWAEEESDVKAGFANDIIYRATGLSADEYENKEEKSSKHRSKRQEMKKWRIIQGYTQEELAKELGIGGPQIHYYEQGSTMFGERLWEIARKLSVNVEDLVTEEECYEDKDGEGEKELLSWARESKKISNQKSRDELGIWIEFLFQRRQIYEEKINKIEGIKVANNLIRMGVSIDVISQITGLNAKEFA